MRRTSANLKKLLFWKFNKKISAKIYKNFEML